MSQKHHVWKTILLWGLPIIVGGGLILYFLKMNKAKKAVLASPLPEPKTAPKPAASSSIITSPSSDFPLEKGDTDSDSVRALQRILGVKVDGDFGPATLSALQAFAGTSTVANQAALDALNAKKSAAQNSAASMSRAQQLFSTVQDGKTHDIIVTTPTVAYGYTMDAYSAIIYTDHNINLAAHTYSGDDYKLTGYTVGGNLQLNVNKGDYAGDYIINPNVISVGPGR